MSVRDYGPVPVSRLKDESTRIFEALEDGRRVIISRHGLVTAAITPASLGRHILALAKFALGEATDEELTATDFGQGSPSSFIHKAEAGAPSLVTRNSKVYGVLESVTAGGDDGYDDPEFIERREAGLAKFEQEHPDATPEEFAAEVERWTPDRMDELPPTAAEVLRALGPGDRDHVGLPRSLAAAFAPRMKVREPAVEGRAIRVEVLLAKGSALVAAGNDEEAEGVYEELVQEYADVPDPAIATNVTRALVSLGRINTRHGYTDRALVDLDRALARLDDPVEPSL